MVQAPEGGEGLPSFHSPHRSACCCSNTAAGPAWQVAKESDAGAGWGEGGKPDPLLLGLGFSSKGVPNACSSLRRVLRHKPPPTSTPPQKNQQLVAGPQTQLASQTSPAPKHRQLWHVDQAFQGIHVVGVPFLDTSAWAGPDSAPCPPPPPPSRFLTQNLPAPRRPSSPLPPRPLCQAALTPTTACC